MRWTLITRSVLLAILACGLACTSAKKQSAPQVSSEDKYDGVVTGTVVNERGDPVADATVSLNTTRPFMGITPTDQSTRTGKFRFGRLHWGKYILCARKESGGYREICDNVFTKDGGVTATLSAREPVADLQVKIGPKAGTLVGTIRDAVTGKPVNPIADVMNGTDQQAVLEIRPASEKGRPFYQAVDRQFTALIPPDADLELEIRARGFEVLHFSVDGQAWQAVPHGVRAKANAGDSAAAVVLRWVAVALRRSLNLYGWVLLC